MALPKVMPVGSNPTSQDFVMLQTLWSSVIDAFLKKTAVAAVSSGIATGSVLAFFGSVVPDGYLLCDGLAVSRATYAALYTTIGISCGSGDGSSTFNVPELRGYFLRGVDGGSGNDPDASSRTAMNPGGNTGDAIGSIEADQVGPHDHDLDYAGRIGPVTCDGAANTGNFGHMVNGGNSGAFGTLTVVTSSGSETRPKNAYCNWIIKT